MKKALLFLVLLKSFFSFSQETSLPTNSFPMNYFEKPMNIPLILSGTFAELRPNHFHSGIDIKTNQREGIEVFSSAEGYVSRIKISHWGFGKAIYITHPNGYTTVYGHLQKFSDRIENFIKTEQYKNESFEVEVFPTAAELPVSKKELIAYSGRTGGFMPPHLHFEIRDTKTEEIINPMYFGLNFSDTTKPKVNTVVAYSLNNNSHINKVNTPVQLTLTRTSNGDFVTNSINAYGKIGFGINAYDQLNAAPNQNGLYSLKLLLNGQQIHEFKASQFAFSETRLINILIDFERFKKIGQRIQKCYNEPANTLSLTKNAVNNGIITVEDGLNYTVEIIASDYKKNEQKITIPIKGSKSDITGIKEEVKTPYFVKSKEVNEFSQKNVKVSFPANTFFNDFYLNFEVTDTFATIHNTTSVPINGYYTLTFDVSKYTEEEKNQLYIASISGTKSSYETTYKKGNSFYTSTKNLGKFTLLSDTKKPTISLVNFKDEQWISNHSNLIVKISDVGSGIKSYRAEIDGKWILMEYDVINSTLTYDLNDAIYTEAKHLLKVVVIDSVGNLSTLESTFFRK